MIEARHRFTYVLPIRTSSPHVQKEFCDYLQFISQLCETIVVDGSDDAVFSEHERAWGMNVVHVAPDEDLTSPMGKVGGVLTGLRRASSDKVIIADDDVRYDATSLMDVVAELEHADVVRPQNYFAPLPWHALWDTGRILLNRISGGDWPGTLGVSRSVLMRTGGYDGGVMFENLELVRTIIAGGGREAQLPAVFVQRRPATPYQFWSQRIRQAYDEFARPGRLVFQLAVLPALIAGGILMSWLIPFSMLAGTVALAEVGRRRDGGVRVFPGRAVLLAPVWVIERAICAWLAVITRVVYGGVPYRGRVLKRRYVVECASCANEPTGAPRSSSRSRTSISIGLNVPLFESSAEQAVIPTTMSISARRSR